MSLKELQQNFQSGRYNPRASLDAAVTFSLLIKAQGRRASEPEC
jgi:hypothetical protein